MTTIKQALQHKPLCDASVGRDCSCGIGEAINEYGDLLRRSEQFAALTERVRVLEATLSYVERQMSDPQKGKFTALQVVRGVISPPAGPGDGG